MMLILADGFTFIHADKRSFYRLAIKTKGEAVPCTEILTIHSLTNCLIFLDTT
jgi:hypothetical protein